MPLQSVAVVISALLSMECYRLSYIATYPADARLSRIKLVRTFRFWTPLLLLGAAIFAVQLGTGWPA